MRIDSSSRRKSFTSTKHLKQKGYTVNELLVLSSVLLLIVGLAVPGFLRVRNEASVIQLLETITTSQADYAKSCGAGGYAMDFSALTRTVPTASLSEMIPSEFTQSATPSKYGFDFELHPGSQAAEGPLDCNGKPTRKSYTVTAEPVIFGVTGIRSFSTTSEKRIWQINANTAPQEPFTEPATIIQ